MTKVNGMSKYWKTKMLPHQQIHPWQTKPKSVNFSLHQILFIAKVSIISLFQCVASDVFVCVLFFVVLIFKIVVFILKIAQVFKQNFTAKQSIPKSQGAS